MCTHSPLLKIEPVQDTTVHNNKVTPVTSDVVFWGGNLHTKQKTTHFLYLQNNLSIDDHSTQYL